ncbi:MAG: formylglycine-generating enzyme family protein, partial [Opitutaceae bacterium]|nr:formylglycine-generating enzyme family protein [Opitutaceae bacterium]
MSTRPARHSTGGRGHSPASVENPAMTEEKKTTTNQPSTSNQHIKMNTQKKTGMAALLATLAMTGATAFGAIDMAMVKVGDAGNTADSTGYGAVSYEYYIGTYEVTNAQYAAFLNAVAQQSDTYDLYNVSMGNNADYGGITRSVEFGSGNYEYTVKEGWGNKPVNYVTFWDAARFTNWLTNGATSGASTETGVYTLGGEKTPANGSITRNADAWAAGGFAIASEDEWYKAAYYNGNDAGTYRMYPVTGTLSQDNANYYDSSNSGEEYAMPGGTYIADVNQYDYMTGASSFYGTYQQGGNLREWNDTLVAAANIVRGGAFGSSDSGLATSARSTILANVENYYMGFRV